MKFSGLQSKPTFRKGMALIAGLTTLGLIACHPLVSDTKEIPEDLGALEVHLDVNQYDILAETLVLPSCYTIISPDVHGKISWVNPHLTVGSTIGKGDVIAKLEPFEYQSILSQREAVLEQAKHDCAVEQSEALKAVKRSYAELDKKGSESDLVLRVSYRRALTAKLKAAETALEEAKQELSST